MRSIFLHADKTRALVLHRRAWNTGSPDDHHWYSLIFHHPFAALSKNFYHGCLKANLAPECSVTSGFSAVTTLSKDSWKRSRSAQALILQKVSAKLEDVPTATVQQGYAFRPEIKPYHTAKPPISEGNGRLRRWCGQMLWLFFTHSRTKRSRRFQIAGVREPLRKQPSKFHRLDEQNLAGKSKDKLLCQTFMTQKR